MLPTSQVNVRNPSFRFSLPITNFQRLTISKRIVSKPLGSTHTALWDMPTHLFSLPSVPLEEVFIVITWSFSSVPCLPWAILDLTSTFLLRMPVSLSAQFFLLIKAQLSSVSFEISLNNMVHGASFAVSRLPTLGHLIVCQAGATLALTSYMENELFSCQCRLVPASSSTPHCGTFLLAPWHHRLWLNDRMRNLFQSHLCIGRYLSGRNKWNSEKHNVRTRALTHNFPERLRAGSGA